MDVLVHTELDYCVVRHEEAGTVHWPYFPEPYAQHVGQRSEELVGKLTRAKAASIEAQVRRREVKHEFVKKSRRQCGTAAVVEVEKFGNDGRTKDERRKFRRENES